MLRDTKSDQVRLTDAELGVLRRRAAAHGEAVNQVRTQDDLLEATMKGADPGELALLLEDLLQFAAQGRSTLTDCPGGASVKALLRAAASKVQT